MSIVNMPSNSYNKNRGDLMFRQIYLLILVTLVILSGCAQSTKVDKPTHSRFYDNENNLIGTYEDINAIPEEYSSYLVKVVDSIENKTGLDPVVDVLDIHTNLDRRIQEDLYSIDKEHVENTTVVKENKSGKVLAMVDTDIELDFVKDGERNINKGVTTLYDYNFSNTRIFIPLVTYGMAFEYLGLSTSDFTLDESFQYPGTDIKSQPDGEGFFGVIPIKDAFSSKLTAPTMYLTQAIMKEAGYNVFKDFLTQFSEEDLDPFVESPSSQYSLGVHTTTVEKITNAYQLLLNEGVYHETQFVNNLIHYYNDDAIDIDLNYNSKNVLTSEASYLVTELLKYSVSTQSNLKVIEKNIDYDLFGYGDYRTYIEASQENDWTPSDERAQQVDMNVTAVGNVGYSIVSVSRYDSTTDPEFVNMTTQNRINKLLNTIDSKYEIPKNFIKPLNIEETNFAKGSVDQFGIDKHLENTEEKSNVGYKKK